METYSKEDYRWSDSISRVKQYFEDNINYIDANIDPEGYYNQYIEKESRAFALAIRKELEKYK